MLWKNLYAAKQVNFDVTKKLTCTRLKTQRYNLKTNTSQALICQMDCTIASHNTCREVGNLAKMRVGR